MMAKNRGLKNRIPISSTIKIENLKWLKQYSEETSIPISKLLDKAIVILQKSTIK